ncbi:ribonuclease D [Limoniibacter endophyticus]|uniref:Ribonuclease D n=1 Tax=Limoniibacter endophyticus TaxID=1565040 RepID=A0A8J3DNL1_9HYPH|nr:ribonuclease D [Limoniibacter endophyticus]GHC68459.1 ribonuclease D [Limoniibacter endophyticus]
MKLITRQADLESAIEALSSAEFITIDTEFMRESTFWPQLCLIQMAAPDGPEVLVDPIGGELDLKPFFGLMANEKVLKVFHAARQDIEIIHHLGGLIPSPVFDTQIAAMVCGFGDSVSYDQLVSRTTGGQIDKTSRFTDWARRPLSEQQLEYALADVTHLIGVYEYLRNQLERENRTHWMAEELGTLTAISTYDQPPEEAWKRLKLRLKKPQELAIVREVAAWREREARARDVPRSRVIKDDAIFEIGQQQPKTTEALGRLRTTPRGWERSQAGQDIVAAVNAALAIPKDEMPRFARPTATPEGAGAAVELMKVLLRIIAEQHSVAPKVLASSDDIEKIAVDGADAQVPALEGWRREVFGDRALDLIQGRIGIKFEKKKIRLFDI